MTKVSRVSGGIFHPSSNQEGLVWEKQSLENQKHILASNHWGSQTVVVQKKIDAHTETPRK